MNQAITRKPSNFGARVRYRNKSQPMGISNKYVNEQKKLIITNRGLDFTDDIKNNTTSQLTKLPLLYPNDQINNPLSTAKENSL